MKTQLTFEITVVIAILLMDVLHISLNSSRLYYMLTQRDGVKGAMAEQKGWLRIRFKGARRVKDKGVVKLKEVEESRGGRLEVLVGKK